MKIDKYEKIAKDQYRLYLDNGEVIDTYDNVILKNNLLLKKELDNITYNQVLEDTLLSKNYNACIKYITIRIRCEKEIKDYLKKKKLTPTDIDKIIHKLKTQKILDDDYFTQCFIKDKIKFTSWGPYKITNELKKYEINIDIINKYNYLLDEDTIQNKLKKLIAKQIETNKKLDKNKLRNKIYNNFLRQGFTSNMIITILNETL